jgi:sporulation protein YlmC with PRC-barrel domain
MSPHQKEDDMNQEAMQFRGLSVHDVDGAKVGDVVDFYFDASTNEPEWLLVRSGLIGHETTLVPLADIQRDENVLRSPYPKDVIMDAPNAGGWAIDDRTERALFEHFHLRRELPERTEERAAFEQVAESDQNGARLRSWKASNAA